MCAAPAGTSVLVLGHRERRTVPRMGRTNRDAGSAFVRRATRWAAAGLVLLALAGCQTQGETRTLTLRTLSDSGVTGTVTLTELDAVRTQVVIAVDPAGNPDMPAHIHAGTCDALVPQPRYPLASVVNGASTTEVPAGFAELLTGDVAVNLHKSNEELEVYTACIELGVSPAA